MSDEKEDDKKSKALEEIGKALGRDVDHVCSIHIMAPKNEDETVAVGFFFSPEVGTPNKWDYNNLTAQQAFVLALIDTIGHISGMPLPVIGEEDKKPDLRVVTKDNVEDILANFNPDTSKPN